MDKSVRIENPEEIKKLRKGICILCKQSTISCSRTMTDVGNSNKMVTNSDSMDCRCSNPKCSAWFKISKNLYDKA